MEVVNSLGSPPPPHEVFVRTFSSLATEFDIASGPANKAPNPHVNSWKEDRGEPWETNNEEEEDEEEKEKE